MHRPVTKLEALLRARKKLHATIDGCVREIEAANWRGEFEETIPLVSRTMRFENALREVEGKIWKLLEKWLESQPEIKKENE